MNAISRIPLVQDGFAGWISVTASEAEDTLKFACA